MKVILIILIINLTFPFGFANLNKSWLVFLNSSSPESFSTTIPVGTYKLLDDQLLFNKNDVKYRYIGNSSSTFFNQFSLNSETFQAPRLLLVFHGLDTFATIQLNDHEIGQTSNMFTRYVFDVKKFLFDRPDKYNKLIVNFESAVETAERVYENHKDKNKYIVYPKCVPDAYNGECHVNHIRKMQAAFGWDWGPAYPGSAIWREVNLIPVNHAVLMDHTVDVYPVESGKNWRINVTVLLEVAPNTSSKPVVGTLQVSVETDNQNVVNSTGISISNGVTTAVISITLEIPESSIQRWWPHGYGAQALYNLTIQLSTISGTESCRKRIGFRTVELVQEVLDKGLSFYFRINDIPIFAKGSNIIPISILPEQSNNKTYVRNLLSDAKDVHMNMLRVWGGGIYESDHFYDVADEFGIMIWQDFMFACAMYPTTEEYLDSVKLEIVQNVWRLKSHASIVIWAGNNENEAALYGNWYGTANEKVYRDDYIKLYVQLIKLEVEKLDPTRPFVVSSPSNGKWADDNGWIGTDPYSFLYGDIHWYNYIANGWDMNTYPRPRFSSEYGVQSLPSIHNLRTVASSSEDLTIDSPFIKHRQHLPGGNAIMKFLISLNFNIPQSNDSMLDFQNYIYLSQINQAQSMKMQTEFYRQAKSRLNDAGEGKTMGALYWQLNDVWQAPSWSSIDNEGRWKMLHYYAQDFFAPIIISPRLSLPDDLSIFIVSDELHSRENCTVLVNVHKIWNNSQPEVYWRKFMNVKIEENAAIELTIIKLKDILQAASCGNDSDEATVKCIIEMILQDSNGDIIAPANYVYPSAPKDFILPSCGLTVSFASALINNRYAVTVDASCGTQLFVWFDSPSHMRGRFSENGFPILNGRKTIYYYPVSHDSYIDVSKFNVVTLGQIYSSPQPSNRICVDCI